ncbi:hypothetical protein [Nocardia tenerifensis]|uniref:hypothetical protein n=1 Tax=Nocardia tenerifensis TaxID=228006 RepID=UPI0012F65CA5|nr:hypothetical protein [Nocardia tenerifensis]
MSRQTCARICSPFHSRAGRARIDHGGSGFQQGTVGLALRGGAEHGPSHGAPV